MLVNLTDVFTNEGQVQELTIAYEPDIYVNRLGSFPIKDKSLIALKLSNIGESKVFVEGNVKLVITLACDRCLSAVDYTFDLSFSIEVVPSDNESSNMEDEQSGFMEGYHLNIDELVNHEILLNWPVKILCSESCKGICKVCGKNRNDGDCGCDDFIPDPRMAVIQDIFNANKEV